ncbi:DDE-type integrase/transposase/recombinase [Bordetella pseudohinzii]|uniref:DDE-type integrase/transposase/recombinase n=1 Tax=Bordetella pseudohinzii TaxID=1331258 RepID=UPI00045A165A|nr:DDE-type integrase/transposase/recombinase [Bordetella pseudohinzii]
MIRFTFKRGLAYIDVQTRWVLERALASGKYQFISDAGELLNLSPDEVHGKWLSGQWHVDPASLGTMASATYVATPRDFSTYSDHQQQVATRKLKYLQAVSPDTNRYEPVRWKQLIDLHASQIGDENPPCSSSVQNWWRKYRVTKSIDALIPRKGGRASGRAASSYEIFEQAVAEVFLTLEKQPKVAVFERVSRHFATVNAARPSDQQLICPARSTVYRWLNGLRQDIVDGARLGADAARAKYRIALGGLRVDGVLERVEIDHTPLDLIVIDGETQLPLGRPWLTMAIDKASRFPMGFYLGLNTPNAHAVLQCLTRSILPKTKWLAQYPEIKGSWPAHGIPDLIAIDNGMDLHSSALEKACQEIGVQMLFCGARTPEHKGSIERFFRTMNQGLIHRLPGTTFSGVMQRGDYPSEDKAAITLELAHQLLTQWIVDIYAIRRVKCLGGSPLEKWSELSVKRVIELPQNPEQLDVIAGIPATRTLFHYGIELAGLHYNNIPLQEIRRRHGKSVPVDLKFYDQTVDHVHVFDPDAKHYLRVPSVRAEYTKGLNREMHMRLRELARVHHGDAASLDQMLEARGALEAEVQRAVKAKKMAVRKNARRLVGHDSAAQSDPTMPTPQRHKHMVPKSPVDLPPGLDDELPEMGTFGGEL